MTWKFFSYDFRPGPHSSIYNLSAIPKTSEHVEFLQDRLQNSKQGNKQAMIKVKMMQSKEGTSMKHRQSRCSQ